MPTILDMALLSMDVYEKSEGGLNFNGGIGQFNLGAADSSGFSGFFAQAYNFAGGKVLAYRGTDDIGDVFTGWAGGIIGEPLAPQYISAAQFYQQQNSNSINANPNIYVTGHSLGGGLAGFVGAIYGVSATVFDNINFMGAAIEGFSSGARAQ